MNFDCCVSFISVWGSLRLLSAVYILLSAHSRSDLISGATFKQLLGLSIWTDYAIPYVALIWSIMLGLFRCVTPLLPCRGINFLRGLLVAVEGGIKRRAEVC